MHLFTLGLGRLLDLPGLDYGSFGYWTYVNLLDVFLRI